MLSGQRLRKERRVKQFPARAGMGKRVRARALVAKDGFSARYDLDRVNGVFSRPEHKLAGQSYVDRVLVLDQAKGGVATAWMLHEMRSRGIVPAALVLNVINPIMVQGAALAEFSMLSGFAEDITQAVPNGAMVEVDPESDPPCLRIIAE
jgi:predicted aconitase with swiveling domain